MFFLKKKYFIGIYISMYENDVDIVDFIAFKRELINSEHF